MTASTDEPEFSTADVARLCGVTRPAVVEWIRQGLLPARATGGGHRRVARAALEAFLRAQGYAVPDEVLPARPRVAVLDDDPARRATWCDALGPAVDCDARPADALALVALGRARPRAVAVALPLARLDTLRLFEALARALAADGAAVFALSDDDALDPWLRRQGVARVGFAEARAALLAASRAGRSRRAGLRARLGAR